MWYAGSSILDSTIEEFNQSCLFPILSLSTLSPHSLYDMSFLYTLDDIDHISDELGISWEKSKDQPFASTTTYISFTWDLMAMNVSLAPSKVDKYLTAINEWSQCSMHVLMDVQSLYGKLLHACAAIPHGHMYLTTLECMLHLCHDKPFMPDCSINGAAADLAWWVKHLQQGDVLCPIKPSTLFLNTSAFSDPSSGMVIKIIIARHWRAWHLHPEWSSM